MLPEPPVATPSPRENESISGYSRSFPRSRLIAALLLVILVTLHALGTQYYCPDPRAAVVLVLETFETADGGAPAPPLPARMAFVALDSDWYVHGFCPAP